MSSTMKTKSDYLQLSSSHSYDSSQSPLALLAQTCSSIGKDCPLSTPPIITSLVTKSSTNSFSSAKQSNSTNKKSTVPSKTNSLSKCSSFVQSNHYPPLFDPATTVAALLSRYSYSPTCILPGCLQCESVQRILSHQPYVCHCNAKFRSNDELIEHIQSCHRSSKVSNHHRFHPYSKPSRMINISDQLPFFYPHLSLLPMTEITRHTNHNPNNSN